MNLKLPTNFDILYFQKLIDLFQDLKGQPYSLSSVNKILEEIDKITLFEQFQSISASVEERVDKQKIDLEFIIQETKQYYVEKINIFGNLSLIHI